MIWIIDKSNPHFTQPTTFIHQRNVCIVSSLRPSDSGTLWRNCNNRETFSPSDTAIVLVFLSTAPYKNSDGNTLNNGVITGVQNLRFLRPLSPFVIARRWQRDIDMAFPSVCPSIRLFSAGVVSKRLCISSNWYRASIPVDLSWWNTYRQTNKEMGPNACTLWEWTEDCKPSVRTKEFSRSLLYTKWA